MQVTAQLVKELRDTTGAGMMDCKKALVATEGNIEQAIDWLREKGISKAAKKASRIAAEGLCVAKASGNRAIVFELNCETDFVAKNAKFTSFVEKVTDALLASNATCEECAKEVLIDGKPLKDQLLEQIASIGENLSFRRFEALAKEDTQEFGYYMHLGGKIAALTILNNADFDTAKDVAMQVAASSPSYVSREEIPTEVLDKEKDILTKEALNENAESDKPKPEEIVLKMVVGRLNKNLKQMCLVDQPFVKNPDQSVNEYVKSKGASIVAFRRLAVGEGIEKKEDNFVEEVLNQAK